MADRRDTTVTLRDEQRDDSSSSLRARITAEGELELVGQDLGPMTSMVSDDGEYEYSWNVPVETLPALREVLGAPADVDLLDFLVEHFSGPASQTLESLVSGSGLGTLTVI